MKGKRYPKAVKEFLDFDYLQSLSEEDLAYLTRFSEEFYGASFDQDPLHKKSEQRRELWREKYHRRGDIYGLGLRRDSEVRDNDAVADLPFFEDQSYLQTPEYKEALKEFRAVLPGDRREKALPGPVFLKAEQKLLEVSPVLPSLDRGGDHILARNRLKKMQQDREVLFDLGLVVARHMFSGNEAGAAVTMLDWLKDRITRLDGKLAEVGIHPKPERAVTEAKPNGK